MYMEAKIKRLIKFIKESNKIVFFGGAGVSTESGLKDFRSKDGLYYEKYDKSFIRMGFITKSFEERLCFFGKLF